MDKDFPDLHHKMSKKIAQLTKVIYLLNSRNDDYEQEIKSITDSHENEIEQILKDACRRLSEFQDEINIKNEQIKQNKAIEVYEKEKQHFLQQFDKYKEEAKVTQETLAKKYETQILFITKDMESMKSDFVERVKQFSAKIQATQEDHDEAIEELKHSHEKEVKDLLSSAESANAAAIAKAVQSENEKCTKMLEEQRTTMKAQFDKQLNDERLHFLKEKNEVDMRARQSAAATLHNQKSEHEELVNKEREKFLGDIAKLQDENLQQLKRIQDLEIQLSSSRDTVARLEDKIQKDNVLSSQLSRQLQSVIDKATLDHQSNINSLLLQLDQANTRCIEMDREIKEASAQNKQQSKELTSKFSQELSKVKESESTNAAAMKKNIEALSDELKRAQHEASMLQEEKNKLQEQKAASNTELSLQLSKLIDDHRQQSDSWKAEVAALNEELKQRGEAISASLASSKLLAEKHEEEMRELKTSFARESLQKDSALMQTKAQVEESQRTIHQLEKENQIANERIRNDALHYKKELDKLKSEHGKQIFTLETAIRVKENELKDMVQKNTDHLATIEGLKELMVLTEKEAEAQLKEQVANLTERLNDEWSEKLRKAESSLQDDLSRRFSSAKQEYISLLAQKDQVLLAMENSSTGLKKQIAEQEGVILAHRRQMAQLNDELKEKDQGLTEALKASDEKWQVKLLELQERLEDAYKESHSKNEELFEAKQKEWESAVAKRMQSLSSYHDRLVGEMIFAHKKNVAELTEQLDAKYAQELQQKEKDRQRREDELIRSMKKEKDMAMANLVEETRMELYPLQNALDQKKESIKMLENKNMALQGQVQNRDDEIRRLKGEISSQDADMLKMRQDFARQLTENSTKWTEMHESVLASLEEEHARKISMVRHEGEEAEIVFEQKVADLKRQLEEADDHYRNRSPREQDVELIRLLRADISDKSDMISKMKSEYKHIKLELHNREENFNKIFNKTPQIATSPALSGTSRSSYEGTRDRGTPPKLPPLSARGEKNMLTKSSSPKKFS